MRFETAASFAFALLLAAAATAAAPAQQATPAPAAPPPASAAPAASAAPSAGPVDPAVQKALTDAYALFCTAAFDPSDANLDAAFAQIAPEFVNYDITGKQTTRDQVVTQGKQQLKMLKASACSNTPASIVMTDPNTAQVVNALHIAGEIQAPDGKHQLDLTSKAQDTWKNVNGKWLQTQAKDLQVLLKIDGAVVEDQGE